MTRRLTSILLLFLVLVSLQISCKKDMPQDYRFPDPSTLPGGLKGYWLETTERIDTIVFPENSDEGYLYIRNNHNYIIAIPYKFSEKTIFIIDPLSSCWELANGLNFYFTFDEPNLTIYVENFTYRLSVNIPMLVFRKIK